MENVPVLPAIAGGMLIGLAATLLLLLNGRIAGISGILGGALTGPGPERTWRLAFLAGLVAGGAAAALFGTTALMERTGYPPGLLIAAGLLVGFGSRLGNGCTSGHGVCGIARLSLRSIVATLAFTLTGALTVGLLRFAGIVT